MLHCRLAIGRVGGPVGRAPRCRWAPGSSATWRRSSGPPWSWRPSATPGSRRPPDTTEDTVSNTVMATAMVAGGVTVGAIQVVNKRTGTGAFDAHDRELLEGLAAAAACLPAERPAARRGTPGATTWRCCSRSAARSPPRWTSTACSSRWSTSPPRRWTFDRGAVGLYEKGKCDIRAVAGQETVDPKDPRLRDLIARAEWAAGTGRAALPHRPGRSGLRRRADLRDHLRPGPGDRPGAERPLPAPQGRGGGARRPASSNRPPPISPARPSGKSPRSSPTRPVSLSGMRSSTTRFPWWTRWEPWQPASRRCWRCLAGGSRRMAGAPVLLLAALTLIRWPLRVPGVDPVLRPSGYTPVRVLVDGTVERIDGAGRQPGPARRPSGRPPRHGARGRAGGHRGRRRHRRPTRLAGRQPGRRRRGAAAPHQGRGAAPRARPARRGARPDHRPGARGGRGAHPTDWRSARAPRSPKATRCWCSAAPIPSSSSSGWLSRTSSGSGPGQEVRLRVDALPSRTFEGRGDLDRAAAAGTGRMAVIRYPVRAAVANPDGLLKPEMAAHARVLTEPASTADPGAAGTGRAGPG